MQTNSQTSPANSSSLVNKIIDGISAIFLPIVSLLSAAGILKGFIIILTTTNVLSTDSDTYLVLNAMADSLFYFLPILLAYTSAKKFKANPFTAVVIAGILLYPALNTILESGKTIYFLGLPLKGVTYHSSVIPIILATATLGYVERFFDKIFPDLVKSFLTPLLSIVVVGFITLFLFGPLGAIIGDCLASIYELIYSFSPILSGILLGAIIQPMVIFGFHWSFLLVAMNNVAVLGSDTILALIGPAVFAQVGAGLAVLVKSKNPQFKSLCASSILSAIFGVTEPVLFGINLPRKKPMIAVCIGGGVGGAIAGYSGAKAVAFVLPSLASLPVFLGEGFGIYLFSYLVSAVVAFIVTYVFKFKVDLDE